MNRLSARILCVIVILVSIVSIVMFDHPVIKGWGMLFVILGIGNFTDTAILCGSGGDAK